MFNGLKTRYSKYVHSVSSHVIISWDNAMGKCGVFVEQENVVRINLKYFQSLVPFT